MAKRDKGGETPGAASSKSSKRIRRLERRLEDLLSLEARRVRQAEKARQRAAEIQATLAETLSSARAAADGAAGTAPLGSTDAAMGPRAYCIREKRTVVMVDPQIVTLRDGRRGLAGTCPSCGAHLARLAGAHDGALGVAVAPVSVGPAGSTQG